MNLITSGVSLLISGLVSNLYEGFEVIKLTAIFSLSISGTVSSCFFR